jgi:fatty acyl-CoA reductase
MMDPIIISYGKGQLPGFLVDPNSVLDVVSIFLIRFDSLFLMAFQADMPHETKHEELRI